MVPSIRLSVSSLLTVKQNIAFKATYVYHFIYRDTNALAVSVAPLQAHGNTTVAIAEFQSPLTSISLLSEGVVLLGGAESSEEVGSTLGDGFSGCLDRVLVNNAQLPLLLPNEMDHNLATCMAR